MDPAVMLIDRQRVRFSITFARLLCCFSMKASRSKHRNIFSLRCQQTPRVGIEYFRQFLVEMKSPLARKSFVVAINHKVPQITLPFELENENKEQGKLKLFLYCRNVQHKLTPATLDSFLSPFLILHDSGDKKQGKSFNKPL